MHKKVQSLLITGVLSANMFGSTVAVFADGDTKKENGFLFCSTRTYRISVITLT